MSGLYLVLEAVVALLAAAGLLALGWLVFGRLLAPVGGKSGGVVYAVLPAAGDGATLEHDVSGLLWLRGGGMAELTIVIADCGLTDQGRIVAAILSARDKAVTVCPAGKLEERVRAGKDGGETC